MHFILSIFLLILPLGAQEYSIIPDQAKIELPFQSIEKTKIRLKNNLEAYIISDPAAEKSAAGLTVLAGSWEDPIENPGLAHFLEHMLFLGTKNFPDEGEFDRFVTDHDGDKNAFTTDDSTTFYFTITTSDFKEGLTRFSDFFKNPLFNPSGVNRELHAIDQEYAKNIEIDEIRLMQVLKEVADPTHPFHNFGMGNSKTLATTSQKTLKAWYQEHYSANLMRLVIISPLPLEQIKEWVVKDFSDIPNHDQPQQALKKPLFTTLGKLIYIEPIKNKRTLTIMWDLPARFATMTETQPDGVISHLLGHEGEGTLLNVLKMENLAEGLRCGSEHVGPYNLALYLQIDLTDEGVKQVFEVITRCFQAITFLRKETISPYLFDELQTISKLEYQYQPKKAMDERIQELIVRIPYETMETFPENSLMYKRFDPAATKELLSYLTPNHAVIAIMAPAAMTGVTADKQEKWVSVPYSIKEAPQEIWKQWMSPSPFAGFALPEPNPYLINNVNLLSYSIQQGNSRDLIPQPTEIFQNEKGVFYYAQDTRFKSPKICWIFQIKTPSIREGNPQSVVLGDLYQKWITDQLDTETYAAKIAGLNYLIKRVENGLEIQIEGYHQNAAQLLDKILKQLIEATPTKESYQTLRTTLLNTYQDADRNSPYEQGMELAQSVIYKYYSTNRQKATALRRITFEKFQSFCGTLFNEIFIEGVFFGNMTRDDARKIANNVMDSFSGDGYVKAQRLKQEAVILPPEGGPYYYEGKLTAQGNTTILAIENPHYTFQNRAAQQILMQLLGESFFNELRTKQQTGYLVASAPLELERRLFNVFVVQSNSHDVRDLLARFELFLESYGQEITLEINQERFNTTRRALIESLKSSATNTKTMAELLYLLATKYDANFKWMDERIKALETITYEEFLTLVPQFIGKANRQRFALLLKGTQNEASTLQYKQIPSIEKLRHLSSYVD